MALTIITNNVPRDTLNWWELTTKECGEFGYVKDGRREQDVEFFRYKGQVYDLDEMQATPSELANEGWDGYMSDTFFSGILVKYFDENGIYDGQIVVGRFYS